MENEFLDRLREVVDMNVGWQQAYDALQNKVSLLETKLKESTERESELVRRIDSILTESTRREVEMTKKVDCLLEDINLLKIQSCIYKEDFDIERKQRTELGGKLAELEQEIHRRRAASPPVTPRRLFREPQQIILRRIPEPTYGLYQTDNSRDEPDALEPTCLSMLYCPNCHQSFTVDDHSKLMDHMDSCK